MICTACSGTGFKVGLPVIEPTSTSTAWPLESVQVTRVACKKCDSTGYYDPDSMVTVPHRAVKDEYWRE